MDQPITAVDVELAVRTWARQEGLADRRVFFGISNEAPFPQIIVRRLGGPDQSCLIQFDIWGANKAETADLAAELATACEHLVRFETSGVLLHGTSHPNVRWLPDPESDQPRHIVDVIFTATATADTGS